MFNQSNSKKRGDVGLAASIYWFTKNGYTVSLPLTDSQDYDLIVDDGNLFRVQVKTCSFIRKGRYEVSLTVNGGNRTGTGKSKKLDPSKVDLVFILTSDDSNYLIPTSRRGTSMVCLGPGYDDCRV